MKRLPKGEEGAAEFDSLADGYKVGATEHFFGFRDGVHPSCAGHQAIYEAVARSMFGEDQKREDVRHAARKLGQT